MSRIACLVLVWMVAGICLAQQTFTIPRRPVTGYVLDQASIINPADVAEINRISKLAQDQAKAPIVVVTLPSLASVGADQIEWYATSLFNAWAIGDRKVNRGVLVLVARDDHRARIELGAGWKYERDDDCKRIMDRWMIPRFKENDYSKGILDGVKALDSMVRTGKVPMPPIPVWIIVVIIVAGVFIFLLILNLVRNGMNSWGGSFLRGLGQFLINFISSSGRYSGGSRNSFSGGGGGFSGGGFSGGGFSGGGGSSGSW